MYDGLEWLKIKLSWTNLTLPKVIKSKSEMKGWNFSCRAK